MHFHVGYYYQIMFHDFIYIKEHLKLSLHTKCSRATVLREYIETLPVGISFSMTINRNDLKNLQF